MLSIYKNYIKYQTSCYRNYVISCYRNYVRHHVIEVMLDIMLEQLYQTYYRRYINHHVTEVILHIII